MIKVSSKKLLKLREEINKMATKKMAKTILYRCKVELALRYLIAGLTRTSSALSLKYPRKDVEIKKIDIILGHEDETVALLKRLYIIKFEINSKFKWNDKNKIYYIYFY
ncbi:unnamed protein product [Blepharisma stoltei]|uniref:Uncharacterized protein n=1 Tax=Blepharisma stoltei TaxID=1481888 RepID=A0AAU9JRY8_9CILI|nr:unnamed protein product [Blepharisma stoltei]